MSDFIEIPKAELWKTYKEAGKARFLLQEVERALNDIPNRKFRGNEGDSEDTYELVSKIGKFLKDGK